MDPYSVSYTANNLVAVAQNLETQSQSNVWSLVGLGITLVLLICSSAFFSACETAFTSITNYQWKAANEGKEKSTSFRAVMKLLDNYNMLLISILISNTLINILATTISVAFFENLFGLFYDLDKAETIATIASTIIMTVLVLMFGEYLPKAIARKHSIKYIRFSWILITCAYYLFWPFGWLIDKCSSDDNKVSATEKELNTLIETIESEGVLEPVEASLVRSAFNFDEKCVKDVMTTIDKVVFVNADDTIDRVIEVYRNGVHSRLLVKQNNRFIGAVRIRKALDIYFGNETKRSSLHAKDIMDRPPYIDQDLPLDKTLLLMQVENYHLAIVTKSKDDKEIVGIVTLEDLVEELVGEIFDESDYSPDIQEINDFTWRVDSYVRAREFIRTYIDPEAVIPSFEDMKSYIVDTFDLEKLVDGDVHKNHQITVTVKYDEQEKEFFYIIEKNKLPEDWE